VAGCDLLPVCQSLDAAVEVAARLSRPALGARVRQARDRLRRYSHHLRRLRQRESRRFTIAEIRRRLRSLDEGLAAATRS
jgi:hypothetical protein